MAGSCADCTHLGGRGVRVVKMSSWWPGIGFRITGYCGCRPTFLRVEFVLILADSGPFPWRLRGLRPGSRIAQRSLRLRHPCQPRRCSYRAVGLDPLWRRLGIGSIVLLLMARSGTYLQRDRGRIRHPTDLKEVCDVYRLSPSSAGGNCSCRIFPYLITVL